MKILILLFFLISCASNHIKPADQNDHAIHAMSPDRLSYGTLGTNEVEHNEDSDSGDSEGGDGDSGQ